MNFSELSKNLLNKGLFITMFYFDKKNIKKRVCLLSGKWIKDYLNSDLDIQENEIYDVFSLKSFDFKKYIVDSIEYPIFPQKLILDSFIRDNKNICEFDLGYKEKVFNLINEIKFELNMFLKSYIFGLHDKNEKDLYDHCILRFYPEKIKNKKNLYEQIKNDAYEKYFISYDQNKTKDDYMIPSSIMAFRQFGICKNNENTTDDIFLNALKRQWLKLMLKFKDEMIDELRDTDISFLNDKERQDFNIEIENYKKTLEKEINMSNLDPFKTPIEVISYWHSFLQPKPCFVYENE